jgi:hypothetical protein
MAIKSIVGYFLILLLNYKAAITTF